MVNYVLLGETWVSAGESGNVVAIAETETHIYYVKIHDIYFDTEEAVFKVKIELYKVDKKTLIKTTTGPVDIEPGQSIQMDEYVVEVPQITVS